MRDVVWGYGGRVWVLRLDFKVFGDYEKDGWSLNV